MTQNFNGGKFLTNQVKRIFTSKRLTNWISLACIQTAAGQKFVMVKL